MTEDFGEFGHMDDWPTGNGLDGDGPASRRRLVWMAIALVGVLLVAGAVTVAAHVLERRRNAVTSVPHQIVTADGPGYYTFRRRRSTITVSAPQARAINIRTVFWPESAVPSVDQESCITWATPDGRAQPGMAMRIDTKAVDQGKAILLTQNVFARIYFEFYVLGIEDGDFAPVLGKFDLRDVVWGSAGLRPGPWHICTRVIGPEFGLKIWFPGQSEPSWNAPGPQVRRLTLPSHWVYKGYPGAYLGHLKPGASFVFTDQRTRSIG